MTIAEMVAVLDGWHLEKFVAIEGQNAISKSTFCHSLKRNYNKINLAFPEVATRARYNFSYGESTEYLFGLPANIAIFLESYTIWDRCCFANIMFYIVHDLCETYVNRPMPFDQEEIWRHITCYVLKYKLKAVICRILRNSPMKIMFLVCSDMGVVAKALNLRGKKYKKVNDLFNSLIDTSHFARNYQVGQYMVMLFVAMWMKAPLFDIMDFYQANYSLNEMHTLLASKVDIRIPNPPAPKLAEFMAAPRKTYAALLTKLQNHEHLLYQESCK